LTSAAIADEDGADVTVTEAEAVWEIFKDEDLENSSPKELLPRTLITYSKFGKSCKVKEIF